MPGVYLVLALLVPDISPRHVLIAAPIILVMLALLLMMRRGYVRLASVALNASIGMSGLSGLDVVAR